MTGSLREAMLDVTPPFLQGDTGGTICRAFGAVLDALTDRENQGVSLRFPQDADPSALGYIGNDRQIERGPGQTSSGYAAQLVLAFDTWQNAGGARTVLSQLRAYFAPSNGPPIRLVSQHPSIGTNGCIWNEIDSTTGIVTRTTAANWRWDSTTKWHKGWAIVDGTGLWLPDYWDEIGTWGDGGVWGSSMTYTEVRNLVNIVLKWKGKNVYAQLIVIFDPTLFLRLSAQPPNPNGQGESDAWRAPLLASFMEPST